MKNLGTIDRLLRAVLAEVCVLSAFFWVGPEWQIPLYLVAGVMLLQAATGSCGLYSLLGKSSCERVRRKDKNLWTAFVVTVLVLAVLGSYASSMLTRSIFLEDLGRVKEPYNLVLQYSGQGMRQETIEHYGLLEGAWGDFQSKYSQYRPLEVKFDGDFPKDMESISDAISSTREDISSGNLTLVHDRLQKAEPILQKMLERR